MPALPSIELSAEEKACLLRLARDSINRHLAVNDTQCQRPPDFDTKGPFSSAHPDTRLPPILLSSLGCFVTLTIKGELRGCIGCIDTSDTLVEALPELAISSAFYDTRFSPLTQAESKLITIEISLLSPMVPIKVANQAELAKYLSDAQPGLVLTLGNNRAVFLPQVWMHLANANEFIYALKQKVGWSKDFWSADLKVEIFTVSHFSDHNENI